MYFVYILKCEDGSLYTGITNNLEKRMQAHRNGKGSKYIRSRGDFELVFQETYETKSEAMKREAEIKKFKREEKLKLITK